MKKWWHEAIGYQIYPKSFMDSNGDGIGDINGIIEKLDYLYDLGINLVWICPIFKSPQIDHGYDISNYDEIDEMYGTKEQLKFLIDEASKREIKVILDLVVNHTSDQHEWFQKALQDPFGEYGKYYIFRHGTKDTPPNNWTGIFNGSTWEKVGGSESDLYYLHIFTTEQPDLNWENPKLRQEIYDMVNRWLDFGIAGFRVDAISHIKKNFEYVNRTSDRADGLYFGLEYFNNCDGIVDILQELKRETFAKHDCFTVGEVNSATIEKLDEYAGENGHFSSVFDFSHTLENVNLGDYKENPIKFVEFIKGRLFNIQNNIGKNTFMTNITENHDLCRSINRFIPVEHQNFHSKTLIGTVNFFMRGIPFLYQGQDIGMVNFEKSNIDEFRDPTTIRQYKELISLGKSKDEALLWTNITSREHSRTPIQWDETPNSGFTNGKPWFEINPNYTKINAENQIEDSLSIFNYYKQMIQLRKEYKETFVSGDFITIFEEVEGIIAYKRNNIAIINNCTSKEVILNFKVNEILLSNYEEVLYNLEKITLKPFQSVITK